jgi:hypothetical protein
MEKYICPNCRFETTVTTKWRIINGVPNCFDCGIEMISESDEEQKRGDWIKELRIR